MKKSSSFSPWETPKFLNKKSSSFSPWETPPFINKKSSSFSPWETPPFINKKSSSTFTTKTKAIKKIQKFIINTAKPKLLPFINRVSANINDRIYYSNQIISLFNKYIPTQKGLQCLQPYTIDNKLMFKLGEDIILKYEIGSPSLYGSVYYGTFKNDKLFKFAAKLFLWDIGEINEYSIMPILNDAVFNNKCPHFPIFYAYTWCNNYYINDLLPEIIINNLNNNKKEFCILFNELANGDLKIFNKLNYTNDEYLNSIFQIIISIFFYYKFIKGFHNDTHAGNFLYHKIKKGGYYHYIILGNDFYLKNLGYLWIIWDFSFTTSFTNDNKNITRDVKKIIDSGFRFSSLKIIKDINKICYQNPPNFNIFLNNILSIFIQSNVILTTPPSNSFIINHSNPFIINHF